MSAWEFRRVQATSGMSLPVIIREFNERLRLAAVAFNDERRKAAPLTPFHVMMNGTYPVFIAPEVMEFTGVVLRTSSGTCNVSVAIDGVAVTMDGGSPITATTTATETDSSAVESLGALSVLTVVVSGLVANTVDVVPQVRRA